MARNLYSADIFIEKNQDYEHHLFYTESDERAIFEAKQMFNGVYNARGNFLVLQRVQECPGSIIPDYVTIFDGSDKGMLTLSSEQKTAVKDIYNAIRKAKNLGVRFVESPNYGIYAFNGERVEEWDIDPSPNGIEVSFDSLTYVGPSMYEQSAYNNEIYIKFKG